MNTVKKVVAGGAIAATSLIGGAVGATLIGTALADTTPSTSTADPSVTAPPDTDPSGTDPSDTDADSDHARGHGGSNGGPHEANGITETPLTGDELTKATAAAEAAVPGATVERAETDAEGAAYEVHMTKADGSEVTVKLDSNFAVTETLDGRA